MSQDYTLSHTAQKIARQIDELMMQNARTVAIGKTRERLKSEHRMWTKCARITIRSYVENVMCVCVCTILYDASTELKM